MNESENETYHVQTDEDIVQMEVEDKMNQSIHMKQLEEMKEKSKERRDAYSYQNGISF